jgi:hypothetical protein
VRPEQGAQGSPVLGRESLGPRRIGQAQILTDMLDGAAEQRDLLAGARPYSLDNTTLDHVERVYREGMDGHVAFENQLARWQRDHPDAEGRADLAHTQRANRGAGKKRVTSRHLLDREVLDHVLVSLLGVRQGEVGVDLQRPAGGVS